MKKYIEMLKKFNDFYGTESREEFAHFALIHTAIICVLTFLCYATDHAFAVKVLHTITGLFIVGTILSSIAVFVRRLNALGRNPKLIFAALIPVLGLLYLIFVCFKNDGAEHSPVSILAVKRQQSL
ncbi:DUF805 domain-containing protein [Maridesulfovibrio zosterae]|uniref:DUF805 domain-containing protein n=1 Tax=Maridesulfovibrio zosterae TaxID=82171 RepID=UPI000424E308|nr:DUF805 domain-containing protein [Maridesulfovibrio zosterae]